MMTTRYQMLLAAFVLAAIAGPTGASAQEGAQEDAPACADPGLLQVHGGGETHAEFARLAEITGRTEWTPGLIRRWSDAPAIGICGAVPWQARLGPAPLDDRPSLGLLPVRSNAVINTGFPVDRNDGALRAGKGLSAELRGGVGLRWGVFSAAVAPQLVYQGNDEYVVPLLGRNDMDWPERVGTTGYAVLDAGQSYARVDAYGVAVGVSTENLWVGPGLSGSTLLSSTAPGFPHVFVGTSRPVDVRIGDLDAEAFWGRLAESRLFDEDEDNDHRRLFGLALQLEPRGVPGLHLGLARLHQRYTSDALGPEAADARDELIALYFRWVLPESGFEVFGEWAKYHANDGTDDDEGTTLYELLVEPEDRRTYLVGLQKVFDLDQRWVRVYGEIANLNPTLPMYERGSMAGIYRHSVIRQGHTHRGQLLGSWTGPGSDYQVLGAELLERWGAVGLFVERVRRNVDVHFSRTQLRTGGYPLQHDAELTAGTRAAYFWRDLEASATAAYSHRRNRGFLPPELDEIEQGYRVDSNWNLQLGVTWYPDRGRWTFGLPGG